MAELASLTFPRYRKLLDGAHDRATPVIVEEAGEPVGLALLFRADSPEGVPPHAQLLSIMVAPERRRSGIARQLLARAEETARCQDCGSIKTWYSTRLPMCHAFERLLAGAGWDPPVIEAMRTAGHSAEVAAEMERIEPARRPYYPAGATVEPWSTVTENERVDVDALVAAIDFNDFMAPSLQEKTAHPELSLVLRVHGRIAGWVFGEAVAPDLCYYANGYVIPELRRRGALVGLIRDVCRRQAELFGPMSVSRVHTTPATPGMPRFMRERLGPCALWYDEYRRVSKRLTAL